VDADTSGWKEVNVKPRTTLPTVVSKGLQMGRRTQYAVRYFLASTIHRVQGDTISLLATELSLHKKQYRLWQREQFAVLISRVQTCKNIIFVGNQVETAAAIEHVLSRSSKWDALIEHDLSELNVAGNTGRARQLVLDDHPFMPIYRELPSMACGYSYKLTSLLCVAPSYIGECLDLHAELRKHNTGYGVPETHNTALHPWGIYAVVYGFNENGDENVRDLRNDFVYEWRGRLTTNTHEVFRLCNDIANDWTNGTSRLRNIGQLTVVKCGHYSMPE